LDDTRKNIYNDLSLTLPSPKERVLNNKVLSFGEDLGGAYTSN
jgi:hypothetical protein